METILRIALFSVLLSTMACAQPITSYQQQIAAEYQTYKEKKITHRRFKHQDILPIIQALPKPFTVAQAGSSIEGRGIYSITIGSGKTTVLLWSQMHGDESTATMALFDLFRFFQANDKFNDLRKDLLSELKIVFVPMLNPDGAERFQRRNALGVDLNRDALRLQCPESQLLKRLRDDLQADWGFNLHDQNRYYAAGRNPNAAAISFLAPAYNYQKDTNPVRAKSMQMIGYMNTVLQQYIPRQVARYNDDFEPRAFGDNIQKWGTSTILIESGGIPGDWEKQELRKLNFIALMAALEAIAADQVDDFPIAAYEQIPFNESNAFHDVVLREVKVENNGKWYTVDVGIRRKEVGGGTAIPYYYDADIQDLGDLSTFYAYESINGKGMQLIPGKVYEQVLPDWKAIKQLDVQGLWQKGITTLRLEQLPPNNIAGRIPFRLIPATQKKEEVILPGYNPALLLKEGNQIKQLIINGFVYDLARIEPQRLNWWKGLL